MRASGSSRETCLAEKVAHLNSELNSLPLAMTLLLSPTLWLDLGHLHQLACLVAYANWRPPYVSQLLKQQQQATALLATDQMPIRRQSDRLAAQSLAQVHSKAIEPSGAG